MTILERAKEIVRLQEQAEKYEEYVRLFNAWGKFDDNGESRGCNIFIVTANPIHVDGEMCRELAEAFKRHEEEAKRKLNEFIAGGL